MSAPRNLSFPRLDPLRALCFLAVFGSHAFHTADTAIHDTALWRMAAVTLFGPGPLGVNMFFVLSGFLITHLLLVEKTLMGRIDVPRFWLRRILRIWPLYFLVVVLGFVLVPAIRSLLGQPSVETADPWSYILFYSNITKAHSIQPTSSVLAVLWSIAVEEQFYLVWPVLLVFVPQRWMALPCAALVVTSLLFRAAFPEDAMRQWHSLSCMGDLAMGAMGAALVANTRIRATVEGWGTPVQALLLGALAASYFVAPMQFRIPWLATWHPAMFAAAATLVVAHQAVGTTGVLRLPAGGPLAWLGRISYGLYCLHMPALLAVLQVMPRLGLGSEAWHVVVLQPLATLAITVLLAWASHRWFERPFLRIKDRFAYIVRG